MRPGRHCLRCTESQGIPHDMANVLCELQTSLRLLSKLNKSMCHVFMMHIGHSGSIFLQ